MTDRVRVPTLKYRYDRGERIVTLGARRLGQATLDGWAELRFGPQYTGATGHHLSLNLRWMGRNGR